MSVNALTLNLTIIQANVANITTSILLICKEEKLMSISLSP